ncbi:hypothetical protein E4U12_008515 [Claviceps purpurea]|nr:hypothetical protein E4U12_008515 [Claviceps purpurea]
MTRWHNNLSQDQQQQNITRKHKEIMEIFNFAMYLLAFGTGTSALPDPELGSVTDGEFTYTGGDLPRGDAKVPHSST